MASFSGSKSETVGCGLARSKESREDPNELRVLSLALDISRINCAPCLEVVDPVMAVVDYWSNGGCFDAVRANELERERGGSLRDDLGASMIRVLVQLKSYCVEYNFNHEVPVQDVGRLFTFERTSDSGSRLY